MAALNVTANMVVAVKAAAVMAVAVTVVAAAKAAAVSAAPTVRDLAAVVVGVKVGVTVVAVTKAAVTDRAFVLAHHPVDDQPKPCHAGLFRFWPWLILMRQSFRLEKKIQRRRNQCAPSLNRCGR